MRIPEFVDAHLKLTSINVFAPVGLSGMIEERMRNAGDYYRVLLGIQNG